MLRLLFGIVAALVPRRKASKVLKINGHFTTTFSAPSVSFASSTSALWSRTELP